MTQWKIQVGNIATNKKVKVYFTLPEFTMKKIMTSNFHVDDSVKIRFNMILYIYLLSELGLYLKLSDHVIEGGDGLFKRHKPPMVDLGTYEFKM